jgi:hypothetical protein
MRQPVDRNGKLAVAGSKVRIVSLSRSWIAELPQDEQVHILSMIGETFEVEQIDEYGQPWVRKSWPGPEEGMCRSHSLALEPHEMELVTNP